MGLKTKPASKTHVSCNRLFIHCLYYPLRADRLYKATGISVIIPLVEVLMSPTQSDVATYMPLGVMTLQLRRYPTMFKHVVMHCHKHVINIHAL